MEMRRLVHVVWYPVLVLAASLAVPAISAAAGAEGETIWKYGLTGKMTWRIVDTLVLVGIMVYLLRKPLAKFFRERREQIRTDLEEAKKQRDRAELALKEFETKIEDLEQEIRKLQIELQKASVMEADKVKANADRMAAGIVQAAKVAAEQEVRKAKAALQSEAAELAVQMAEALIREKISADDHKKIVDDYLAKVGGMK